MSGYDETVMQVHKENGRPDTSESRMWVYSSAKRADIQLRCFEYRESRSGKWAKTFLEGFHGVLITDGYVLLTLNPMEVKINLRQNKEKPPRLIP